MCGDVELFRLGFMVRIGIEIGIGAGAGIVSL